MALVSRVTPSGWVVYDDAASFARVTPTGWNQLNAAGGTTFNQSVSGSLTLSASIIKDVFFKVASSITTAGALVTGAQFGRSASGTITLTSVLTDAVTFVRSYGSTIVPSGAIAKPVYKLLVGSIALTATLLKHTVKATFTAALSLSGALSAFSFTPGPGGGAVGRGLRFLRRFIGRR